MYIHTLSSIFTVIIHADVQDWEGTILTVSHDRKFLNEICTDIVHLHTRRLDHYKGNYDNFEKVMHL